MFFFSKHIIFYIKYKFIISINNIYTLIINKKKKNYFNYDQIISNSVMIFDGSIVALSISLSFFYLDIPKYTNFVTQLYQFL